MTRETKIQWDCLAKAIVIVLLMTLGSIAMLVVALFTFFQARRLYTEWMAAPLGRLALRLWGIRVAVHDRQEDTARQRVYISNHTSTVDVFVLIGLGLPNTRFFLSGWLRKILPLGLIGYLIGIFWTVLQEFPERRVEIFRRADRILRRTGESVYLSPEGERITTGQIGPFNKGAFHLATSLRASIVPFYIDIPPGMSPGKGYCPKTGLVNVYFKPEIDVSNWRLEDVVENKEKVRNQFVEWHDEINQR